MKKQIALLLALTGLVACSPKIEPVDYVNPYMGSISHLLVPTYPTVHLPNSMMRMFPSRPDYTTDYLDGLALIVPDHRRPSVINFLAFTGEPDEMRVDMHLSYDNEKVTPYRYQVRLDDEKIDVDYAPSHKSALYCLKNNSGETLSLMFTPKKGNFTFDGKVLKGSQSMFGSPHKVYLYMEFETLPVASFKKGNSVILRFAPEVKELGIRYAISFIDLEQAAANLHAEISDYDVERLAHVGRGIWNEALGKIKVSGSTDDHKTVFYTSLYRTFERPVCITENGRHYSAFDRQVHSDGDRPFYVDDWLWDTYRATHPLRVLIDSGVEADILNSYVNMTDYMEEGRNWLPTFPKILGDSRGMNCNHGVICLYDAWVKGCRDFDLEKAYKVSKGALEDKTLIPWSGAPAGILDDFYKEHGYFPAIEFGKEEETVPEVNALEKRQPVPVTLGTSYDHWALAGMAAELGLDEDAALFHSRALNYRNLFNEETRFFHPKDAEGEFIKNLDYCTGGGVGGRAYYDENNAYTYRWDVQHNIADLIALHGGNEDFCKDLDALFQTPLGMGKSRFYMVFGGNQTGNVGQFGMGNEPSFHIPYLYVYGGQPWKTQKRVRNLLDMWFRNDLMGVPGDEDGGGMSAFVVFSALGFYPVTPGAPVYCIGSPVFDRAEMNLSNGNTFTVIARNQSAENKYIQSARLNGKEYVNSWILHEDVVAGGVLELVMGPEPAEEWGTVPPPSFF